MRHTVLSLLAVLCLAAGAAAQAPDAAQGDMRIPAGSRLYIDKIEGGYDIYLAAAIHEKKVPVVLVNDRAKADFEMTGVTESDKAGWAKMAFLGSTATNEQASIKVVNLKTGTLVWGYNVNKSNSARGKQSSSEACAKHLKDKIEDGK